MINENENKISNGKNMGIEIMRIISMFMIVFLHCFNVGGVLSNVDKFTVNYYISYFLFISSFVAVNMYALTTGYLCIHSSHKYSRLIYLWFSVIFYSIMISVTAYIVPSLSISRGSLVLSFFPLITDRFWYFTAYFLLFLLMPFINAGLKNISNKQFKMLLISLFVMCSCVTLIGTGVGYYSLDIFGVNDGLSFIWIFVLYIFGAYIRLYGMPFDSKNKKLLAGYFFFIFVAFLCYVIKTWLSERFSIISSFSVLSYSFPFIFLASISLFLFFISIRVNKHRWIITKLSSVTFSIYLISTHEVVVFNLQKDLFSKMANDNCIILIGSILLFTIVEYVICTLLALVVEYLFSLINAKRLTENFVKSLKSLMRIGG